MAWQSLAKTSEIPPGRVGLFEVGERRIALCNVDGRFYAVDDVCTHDGGSLDQGELEGHEIECPRHGARFDVRTGRVTRLPAVLPVETYEVRVEGDQVQVEVDEDAWA
jgi:3-phenylpropionate/trans-cinnamate dioxygenase ferredoxin subunit